jgi:hypothetical protein
MRWVIDPRRGPVFVEDFIADLVECEMKNRGFGIDASDRYAFSHMWRGLPASAKVTLPTAPKVDPPKGGWVEPTPLRPPPGVEIVDRLVESATRREKEEEALRLAKRR